MDLSEVQQGETMSPVSTEAFERMVQNRRNFHQNPELSYREVGTSGFVSEFLQGLGLATKSVAGTGVVALVDSGVPGPTILLRADMDALPIQEENEVSYRSRNDGVMHACGHDAHTSILLEAASELVQRKSELVPKGRVLLVFQPAEEGGCGADRMIEEGILEKYKVEAAFGLHVWNHIPVGKITALDGPIMASVDEFKITIEGMSGHGALPQHTVDPILVGSQTVVALQSIVSRNIDPLDSAVVTVGSFHSGEAFNVIPEKAVLTGTIRTQNKETYDRIPTLFERIVKNTAVSFGAKAEIELDRSCKPTINDPAMASIVRRAVRNSLGEEFLTEENGRTMGGEDFSAFLNKVPGCYFFVGSRNEEKGFVHPHHSSHFDIDETCMKYGLVVLTQVALEFLESH